MKGRRGEQQLVLALAKLGYKAERILRQYQTAGQPDVVTSHPKVYTFEHKHFKDSFKTIYDLYYSERDQNEMLAFAVFSKGPMVAMTTDFKLLEKGGYTFRSFELFPPTQKQLRVYNRILKMNELRQTADFLVIKDDGKPRLYLRYYV